MLRSTEFRHNKGVRQPQTATCQVAGDEETMGRHYLEPLFAPASIAVFGADQNPDSVGGRVYHNLLDGGFKGPIYAINPAYSEIQGKPCFAALDRVNGRVDLAVIATPLQDAATIIRACGKHQVKTAILLNAGYRETGLGTGKAVEHLLLEEAKFHSVRLLGPKSLGLMRPASGLNASINTTLAQPGTLALVSQSVGICSAILDWANAHAVGFSTVVSVGAASDIDFGDILDYLAMDPATRSILLYIEGIHDARRFMSGLRAAARLKTVIVVKAGRYETATLAALSHTGALVGADDVFGAALERAGAVRANTVKQLFAAAQLLSKPHRVRGNRLTIISNAGGPGLMAADRAMERGIELAALSEDTLLKLNASLPPDWSHGNPVNILGCATPERYQTVIETCLHDKAIDGLLVLLSPHAMSQPTATATAVVEAKNPLHKPILCCWLGETQVKEGRKIFDANHFPSFTDPENALEGYGFLTEFRRNQELLMQAPGPLAGHDHPDLDRARRIIQSVSDDNRSLLTAAETRDLLDAFNIPQLSAIIVHSWDEALVAAERLGFPVVMKILSPDIVHKSEVGGVRLDIANPEALRQQYHDLLEQVQSQCPEAKIEGISIEQMYTNPNGRELFVGAIDDPVFGPVISFGAGGTAVEILRDRAVALPPLNELIARHRISQTKISKMLGWYCHKPPVNLDALVRVLLRVSEMVCELPQIKAMDINPLTVDETGAWALDVRIVVNSRAQSPKTYTHMAIHPYPSHLTSRFQLHDGTFVTIRPIRPEDAQMEQAFVRNLSQEAKYFRFMESIHELSREMLVRFTQLDYARELAFIATLKQDDKEIGIGVARYFTNPDSESGEMALVVADAWQNLGLGSQLMACIIAAAKEKHFHALEGEVLSNNVKMLNLMKKLGFKQQKKADEPGVVVVTKAL